MVGLMTKFESVKSLRLAAPELRKLLRQTIDQNDTTPFWEAEQRFFGVDVMRCQPMRTKPASQIHFSGGACYAMRR